MTAPTRLFTCDDNGRPWSDYDREDEAAEEAAAERDDAEEGDTDCRRCDGTGEGMYADTACSSCRGRGYFGGPR